MAGSPRTAADPVVVSEVPSPAFSKGEAIEDRCRTVSPSTAYITQRTHLRRALADVADEQEQLRCRSHTCASPASGRGHPGQRRPVPPSGRQSGRMQGWLLLFGGAWPEAFPRKRCARASACSPCTPKRGAWGYLCRAARDRPASGCVAAFWPLVPRCLPGLMATEMDVQARGHCLLSRLK